jgi:cell division protein FtsB
VRRTLRILLAAVAAAAILLLFVLPGRTFISQQHSLSATQRQLNVLAAENARLKAEAKQLQSTSQIEQIAREDYGLVMPGQKAYAVIPAGSTSTTVAPPPHSAAPVPASSVPAGSSNQDTSVRNK